MAKKIFVDAGHGGSDPGAVKYAKESDLNIKVTNFMCEYLTENYECEVYKDITSDSINTVTARANKWGADLVVSNHFNAGGGDGYEALVYSEKRRDLGNIFVNHVKAIGQNSRGVKIRSDLGMLRLTDAPAVLNEGAFVDNWNDIQDWNDDSELKNLGIAYAKACAEFLSLPVKAKKTTTTTSSKKTTTTKKSEGYLVKVTATALNIRKGAGTNYDVTGVIRDKGTYTIVETKNNWGKLKSGVGWICLDFTKKV